MDKWRRVGHEWVMLWLAPAYAAVPILLEEFDDTRAPFAGSEGWEAGYKDEWQQSIGFAGATTDEGNAASDGRAPGFGEGTPADNWVVQTGAIARDFVMDAALLNNDDDAIGLVFRWTSARSFYLLVFTGGQTGPSAKGVDDTFAGGRLYRVEPDERAAALVAETGLAPTQGLTTRVQVKAEGDRLTVRIDGDRNGTFSAAETVIDVRDTSPLPAGFVGLYAYQNSLALFDSIEVSIDDEDGDGIEDTRDVCPRISDPDQADADGDGVGDACTDRDGDGYLATEGDCNDADARINPGAGEVPYDGVDQDCVDGDLGDVDGDGFPGGDQGTDCDDQDAAVHPGAGCDEPAGDADGDGFTVPVDCDDELATINPAATDIPNDGIDQNCRGGDTIDRLVGSGCSTANAAAGWLGLVLILVRRRR